ncbi:MAG TPA: YoaK family protein [Caulobacteraceae bacterium]|jgi:uncharacterized membrane protein YoaK (UPF0700 family)
MKPNLPALLSFTGGYVDTAGFLALQGLFTAHVTGNFVTFGAAIAMGTSGALAKLLALPTFCVVVILARMTSRRLTARGHSALRLMLIIQLALFTLGAIFAIWLGPFTNGDGWPALITGMTLVSAMAIQNAAHRGYLATAPPTTLMTGTTTQIMMDIADLIGGLPAEARADLRPRLVRMSIAVALFAAGCAAAAVLFILLNFRCLAIPPVLGLLALWLNLRQPEEAAPYAGGPKT